MNTPKPVQWWQEYFSPLYKKLYTGVLKEELPTSREVEKLKALLPKKGLIADIGAGYGRHSAPLLRAGFQVIAIDYHMGLLASATASVRRRAVCADMRALPLLPGRLDAALMMFNTFGYFSDQENLSVATGVAEAIKKGGFALFDLPARAGMQSVTENHPMTVMQDGSTLVEETWSFDPETSRLIGAGRWEVGRAQQRWHLSIRVYSPSEITDLLLAAGFTGVACWPAEDLDEVALGKKGKPFRARQWAEATNMFVLAEK